MIANRFFAGGNQFVQMMLKAHAFESLLEHDDFLIAVKDAYGKHLLVSQSHLDAFGFSSIDELNDVNKTPGWPQSMRDEWTQNDKTVIKTGKLHNFLEPVTAKPRENISKENPVVKHASRKLPVLNLFGQKTEYILFFSLTTGNRVDGWSSG